MSDSRRLVVSIDDQTLTVCENGMHSRVFPVSTAIKGMGFTKDSYRTPTGLFRICEKIGAGHASGTIFKARVPVGQWRPGDAPDEDLVLTRILRLDGLESANANTLERCVYLHGTNREDLIGQPAGHGCVRLRNDDMIELFEIAAANDLVEIQPATRPRGALLFITPGREMVPLDGMVELARLRDGDVWLEVSEIRAALEAGKIDRADAWLRCMDRIRPDRDMCGHAAARCIEKLAPGALQFTSAARDAGWLPVFLTDYPSPLAAPVARALGVEHCEAPQLIFDGVGSYSGAGSGYPSTGNFQMAAVIMDWRRALIPRRVMMIGNCAAALETRSTVDAFICLGSLSGVTCKAGICDYTLSGFSNNSVWQQILSLDHAASEVF
jgi:phosphoserine phosphatase